MYFRRFFNKKTTGSHSIIIDDVTGVYRGKFRFKFTLDNINNYIDTAIVSIDTSEDDNHTVQFKQNHNIFSFNFYEKDNMFSGIKHIEFSDNFEELYGYCELGINTNPDYYIEHEFHFPENLIICNTELYCSTAINLEHITIPINTKNIENFISSNKVVINTLEYNAAICECLKLNTGNIVVDNVIFGNNVVFIPTYFPWAVYSGDFFPQGNDIKVLFGESMSSYLNKTCDFGYNIVYLQAGAFKNNKKIERVENINDISFIPMLTFAGCEDLEYIDIHNIEYIGKNALNDTPLNINFNHNALESINGLKLLNEIDVLDLSNDNLKYINNIEIPRINKLILGKNVKYCSIKNTSIGELIFNCENIDKYTYNNNVTIELLTIGDGVKKIPPINATTINTIPNSVEEISLLYCNNTNLVIPENVKILHSQAIYYCRKLENINILCDLKTDLDFSQTVWYTNQEYTNNLKYYNNWLIGAQSKSLSNYIIRDDCTKILIKFNKNATSIIIPASVEYIIPQNISSECNIEVDAENPNYICENGNLVIDKRTNKIVLVSKNGLENIPDYVIGFEDSVIMDINSYPNNDTGNININRDNIYIGKQRFVSYYNDETTININYNGDLSECSFYIYNKAVNNFHINSNTKKLDNLWFDATDDNGWIDSRNIILNELEHINKRPYSFGPLSDNTPPIYFGKVLYDLGNARKIYDDYYEVKDGTEQIFIHNYYTSNKGLTIPTSVKYIDIFDCGNDVAKIKNIKYKGSLEEFLTIDFTINDYSLDMIAGTNIYLNNSDTETEIDLYNPNILCINSDFIFRTALRYKDVKLHNNLQKCVIAKGLYSLDLTEINENLDLQGALDSNASYNKLNVYISDSFFKLNCENLRITSYVTFIYNKSVTDLYRILDESKSIKKIFFADFLYSQDRGYATTIKCTDGTVYL